MDEVSLRVFAAAAAVALIAGPLGCILIWRRMAFFGVTLAHAAVLGVALGIWLEVDGTLGVIAVSVVVALVLAALQHRPGLSTDTLLSVLAHATLAPALIALWFLGFTEAEVSDTLFGDIQALGTGEVIGMIAVAAVGLGVLGLIWRPLLALIVHEDLAVVEGVPVARARLLFLVLIAVFIAIAMKIVGLLLVASILIIPAAAARRFAAGPEAMALFAAVLGIAAVGGGLSASSQFGLPAGPAIVSAAVVLFAFSFAVPARTLRRR